MVKVKFGNIKLEKAKKILFFITTSNSPDISEGYKSWRESFDKGEAGVFNIPASKIIQYIEDVVNQSK